ncbi:sodium hydrogen exchanger [Trichoderma arundinaceum]|uniref:Sodium hydrogen exchanger n=1 Tax=Trichoderma arundinaceum TaxID=490622 RepID=A0A395NR56_TRIAR|nr:sodium hydrogen exchanger [Trichoderma arundinaceum]
MMAASLPYHEPGIVTILVQTSFLLLLNVANFVLNHGLYCGLLGQIFIGVAWGTPGAKWLSTEVEEVVIQLGYLGLLLLVYEGGLSTSLKALKANLFLSSGIAITGISLPMGLSFVLQKLSGATPLQSFASGAALCSTSLGTTFTVLRSTGLMKSRLGVVLTSAAMMDDVVGLVMVQIISNLGSSSTSISAITVVRPLLVSIAFTVCAPLVCVFVAKPVTLWLNSQRIKHPLGVLDRLLNQRGTPWIIHTSILIGCIAGSTYAGTSNLFAAYIAGASISWWDSEVSRPALETTVTETTTPAPVQDMAFESSEADNTNSHENVAQESMRLGSSGLLIFEQYYLQPLDRILKPFFFASIGFSIPISEMFHGSIVWKGIVYTTLMMIGKLLCGIWLLRISITPLLPPKCLAVVKHPKLHVAHFWGRFHEKPTVSRNSTSAHPNQSEISSPTPPSSQETATQTTRPHHSPAGAKPRSIYPASIIGCAMTARGEIGFLISSIAESKRIFSSTEANDGKSSEIFLIVTWAIMLCTVIGPLSLGLTVRRVKQLQQGVERQGRLVQQDVLGVWGVS